jgi:hypothetical protein
MKKRLCLACGVLLAAAVGGALWLASLNREPEPVYNGMRISYWLTNITQYRFLSGGALSIFLPSTNWVHLQADLDFPFRTDPLAPSSLLADPRAVPYLVKALRRDRWIGVACYRSWVWPKLPPLMKSHLPPPPVDNPIIRMRSAEILSSMGEAAGPAIPALIRALREEDDLGVRWNVAHALRSIGKGDSSVTSAFIENLKGNDVDFRRMVTNALWRLDPEAAANAGVKVPSP